MSRFHRTFILLLFLWILFFSFELWYLGNHSDFYVGRPMEQSRLRAILREVNTRGDPTAETIRNDKADIGNHHESDVNQSVSQTDRGFKEPITRAKGKRRQEKTQAWWCDGCNDINFTYIINEKEICGKQGEDRIKLLVLILSDVLRTDLRISQRKSWLRLTDRNRSPDVRAVFITANSSKEYARHATIESRYHHDILQLDFPDRYNNLVLKTLAGLRWASQYCPNTQYLLKTDADVFVHIPNLLAALNSTQTYRTILGDCYNFIPSRNSYDRYYVSKEIFPDAANSPDLFFCSGTGYVMDNALTKAILQISNNIPLLPLEDVYIGLCIRALGNHDGYGHTSVRGFYGHRMILDDVAEDQKQEFYCSCLLTLHYLPEECFRLLWDVLKSQGCQNQTGTKMSFESRQKTCPTQL